MNANLIFKWLRDERYAPAVDVVPESDGTVFLPVEIEASASVESYQRSEYLTLFWVFQASNFSYCHAFVGESLADRMLECGY
jgi:hypothetical protein